MPELPEVEVIVQGLRPLLMECQIVSTGASGKRLRHDLPTTAEKELLRGSRITSIHRRAKYVCISLDSGNSIIIHLGMTGNLGVFPQKNPKAKHDHFWCNLSNNQQLRYNDTRRFGSIQIVPTTQEEELNRLVFAKLGPEPLTDAFTGSYLHKKAGDKTLSVKSFIMTNAIVVGIGNIYANESLFLAGIDPRRQTRSMTGDEWQKLAKCIKNVLTHAIACGGSTINDFVNASQQGGYFQINFKVYGKNGQPCLNCESVINQVTISGRTTFFCPHCQR